MNNENNQFFNNIRNVAMICQAIRLLDCVVTRELDDLNNDIKLSNLAIMILDNFARCLENNTTGREMTECDWNHSSNEMKSKALLSFIIQELSDTDLELKNVLMSKEDWDDNPLEEEFLNQMINKGQKQ